MKPKFTNSFKQILQQSQSEALQRDHQEWRVEHVLKAIVEAQTESGEERKEIETFYRDALGD